MHLPVDQVIKNCNHSGAVLVFISGQSDKGPECIYRVYY